MKNTILGDIESTLKRHLATIFEMLLLINSVEFFHCFNIQINKFPV